MKKELNKDVAVMVTLPKELLLTLNEIEVQSKRLYENKNMILGVFLLARGMKGEEWNYDEENKCFYKQGAKDIKL